MYTPQTTFAGVSPFGKFVFTPQPRSKDLPKGRRVHRPEYFYKTALSAKNTREITSVLLKSPKLTSHQIGCMVDVPKKAIFISLKNLVERGILTRDNSRRVYQYSPSDAFIEFCTGFTPKY